MGATKFMFFTLAQIPQGISTSLPRLLPSGAPCPAKTRSSTTCSASPSIVLSASAVSVSEAYTSSGVFTALMTSALSAPPADRFPAGGPCARGPRAALRCTAVWLPASPLCWLFSLERQRWPPDGQGGRLLFAWLLTDPLAALAAVDVSPWAPVVLFSPMCSCRLFPSCFLFLPAPKCSLPSAPLLLDTVPQGFIAAHGFTGFVVVTLGSFSRCLKLSPGP